MIQSSLLTIEYSRNCFGHSTLCILFVADDIGNDHVVDDIISLLESNAMTLNLMFIL